MAPQSPRRAHPPRREHPRRPPAHKSVSLIHSPTTSLSSRPQHTQRVAFGDPAETDLVLLTNPPTLEQSRSPGESSNAERWFEESNNTRRPGTAAMMDNEPPFFLRKSSSEGPTPNSLNREHANPFFFQQGAGLPQMESIASSSEDFRGVIDDLTIQNKKLKRRLRKYERLHNTHLQSDKLFEIRVHALPPDKKRELEETLRKFAAGLSEDIPQTRHRAPKPPKFFPNGTASSIGNHDSAYASMSGHNSSSIMSGGNASYRNSGKSATFQTPNENIHSYLSDIPSGLLPRLPVQMTEKAKRKLVVKRLEEIFAGKGASMGGHQHPMQQQEISYSAARGDRADSEEGQERVISKEGTREARIMPTMTQQNACELAAELVVESDSPLKMPLVLTPSSHNSTDTVFQASPEQRPTRPLDLDPERAQIPADNIKYLQHLGFSPLQIGSEETLIDGHGYMYLNVLMNMAQLHTISVTPEYVKKSVEQYSQKLELSSDGRKVRWKGESGITNTSNHGSLDDSNLPGQAVRLSKRGSSGDEPSVALFNSGNALKAPKDKAAYVPLFHHADDTDDDDGSSDNTSEVSSQFQNNTTAKSTGVHKHPSKKRHANDGSIIFYNKAPFVTDLSGDWKEVNATLTDPNKYTSLPIRPVGLAQTIADSPDFDGRRFPLLHETIEEEMEGMDLDSSSGSDVLHGFSNTPSMRTVGSTSEASQAPIDLEASGVGGVNPADNFSINIKSRHWLGREHSTYDGPNSRSKTYPARIQNILSESKRPNAKSSKESQTRALEAEIISSKLKNLPASKLPPPSYFPMGSVEDEDEYTDTDSSADSDTESDSPSYNEGLLSTRKPQMSAWQSEESSSKSDEEIDDVDGGASDDSIDMLGHVRQFAPELVRVAEREYDSAVAERLADEIPAGGSAATAGGGSGFNSPATEEGLKAVTDTMESKITAAGINADMQASRGILKRSRNSDTLPHRAPKSSKVEG